MTSLGRINYTIGFNVDLSGLNLLNTSLNSLENLSIKDVGSGMSQLLSEVLRQVGLVKTALLDSFNTTLNTYNIDTFKLKLADNHLTLLKLKTSFNSIGTQGNIAFRNLATTISSTTLPLKETHNLLRSMGTTLTNTLKWSIASSAINVVTSSVQKAWSYTQELDESLNNIMIVTDKSSDSMAEFARQANKAAKELGKSTKDYTNASLIYYQLGLSDAQVAARTETTLKAANVTGQSTEAVSEQLTAVWNGYKVSALESELYIDKLAAVAASTASDLEELSTGMSKVASAANAMGIDIDQLNGMLSTAISVTRQAPETIGTAFKTIFARISDIEAGLDEEVGLGEYTQLMKEVGISVLDANNKLRDQGDVIEEIGRKWESMSREQQISLAQTMAGTRLYNNLLALFDNWSMYEQAMKTSANAAGTLQQQQDIYMESIEAHINLLKTAGERVYGALFDPQSINPLIDVLTEVVDLFGNLVESIGGGGKLLTALVPVFTYLFSGTISSGVATFATNLMYASGKAIALRSALQSIEELSGVGLDKYDAKVNELRRLITLLAQLGVITNETYNTLSNSLNDYANQISNFEITKAQLESGLKDYDALMNNEMFANDDLQKLDIAGLETASKGTGNIIDNSSYQLAIGPLENVKQHIEDLKFNIEDSNIAAREFKNTFDTINIDSEENAQSVQKFKNKTLELVNTAKLLQGAGVFSDAQSNAVKAYIADIEKLNSDAKLTSEETTRITNATRRLFDLTDGALDKLLGLTDSAKRSIHGIATGALPEAEASLNRAGVAALLLFSKEWLELLIGRMTKFASSAAMAVSAVNMLLNSFDIWKNEDLSAGEKVLLISLNILFSATMLLPTLLAIVLWKSKHAGATAATAAATATETTALSAKMVVEKAGLKLTEQETEETKALYFWQNLIYAANKELGKEKAEQYIKLLKQNGALDAQVQKELLLIELEKKRSFYLGKKGKKLLTISHDAMQDMADSIEIPKSKETKEPSSWQSFKMGFKENTSGKIVDGKRVGFKEGLLAGKNAAVNNKAGSNAAALGSAFASILPYAIAIVAAVGAIAGTLAYANNINNKEKKNWEAASAAAKSAADHLSKVQEEWNNLESSISNLDSATKSLDELTEGTVEWRKALSDVNSLVIELIDKYPELIEYTTKDISGALTLSAAGLLLTKEKLLEELEQANAASSLANLSKDLAELELRKNDLAESKVYRNFGQNNTIAATATGAGGLALTGAALGAAIGSAAPIIGTAIGAAAGLVIGLVGGAVVSLATEQAEENYKASLNKPLFKRAMEAYETGGDKVFNSYTNLAAALDKEVSQLSSLEKSLVDNSKETKELAKVYSREQALRSARIDEIGRSIAGEEASEGERKFIGSLTDQKMQEIQKELRDTLGGNAKDKLQAIEYLVEYLGLSAENLVGAKGSNKIQFIDENGQEQTKTMEEIYNALAEYRATNWAKDNFDDLAGELKTGLKIEDESLRKIWMAAGDSGFSLSGYTIGEVLKFNADSLDEDGWKALAKAYGIEIDKLKTNITDAKSSATRALGNPGDLEGRALTSFNNIINSLKDSSGIILEDYTRTANMFGDLFAKFGDEGANLFYTVLNKSENKADDLINKLDEITWTADDARAQFVDLLNELNITIDVSLIDTYVEKMRLLNGAYGYSIDVIKSMVKELREIGDIKRGDIINEEEYLKYLSKYGEDIANSLFAALGNSEYMATAESSKYKSLSEARIRQSLLSDAEVKKNRYNELIGLYDNFEQDRTAVNNLFSKYNTSVSNRQSLIDAVMEEAKNNDFISSLINLPFSYDYTSKTYTATYDSSILDKAVTLKLLSLDKAENLKNKITDGKFVGTQADFKELLEINALFSLASWRNSNNEDIHDLLAENEAIFDLGVLSSLDESIVDYEKEWNDLLEAFNKKYGEFADKDLKAIQQAINDLFNTNLESYQAYLSTATTFDELQEYSSEKVQGEFGVDNLFGLLTDENKLKLQDELKKQTERLAIQLFGQYEDLLGISADAIDNLLPNDSDLSTQERINKYQEMFKTLIENTLEWENILKNTERDLNKIEKVFEDVTGAAAISNLGKLIEALQLKQKQINDYQKDLWLGENGDLNKKLGASLSGFLEKVNKAGYESYNLGVNASDFVDADGAVNWNAFANFEKSITTTFAGTGIEYQETLDSVRESLEKTEEIEEQRLEAIQQELQKRLEKFELEVELELDDENFIKKLNEYQRSLDDDRVSTAKTYLSDIELELSIVETTKRGLSELDRLLLAGDITQKDYITEYEKRLEELQSTLLAVQENIKAIEEARVEVLNDISESYEKQVSYIELINSLLDTSKSSMELLYGEDAYELFDAYYQGTLKNALDIQTVAEQRFADAAAKYASINDGMSDEEKEAIIEEYTSAGLASADAMYAVMEARRDKYLNDTEIAIKNFNKSIYGNLDTELFAKEWDWTKSQADKYYDSVLTLFEKDKLAAQFDTAANEATSLHAQEQINKLKREELAQLEKIEKLSEYDVQHAQKKLDILQAEIALREAQENKTQMRLMRGADGSYSYQYIADLAAISEALNKLTEAQDALYNLEIEEYMSSIDEFLSATQALADTIRELGEDGFTDEELAFIEKQKAEIEYLAKRSSDIRSDVLSSAESAAETFGVNLSELTQGTILLMTKDIDTIIKDVAENGILNSYDLLMAEITDISDEYIKALGDSVDLLLNKISGENGLISTYEDLATKEKTVTGAHKSEYDYLVNNLGPELDSLKTRYDNINVTLDQMVKHYEKLGLVKPNVAYDTSNLPTKNSGSDDGKTNDLGEKKDIGPLLPIIPLGGGNIIEPVYSYDFANGKLRMLTDKNAEYTYKDGWDKTWMATYVGYYPDGRQYNVPTDPKKAKLSKEDLSTVYKDKYGNAYVKMKDSSGLILFATMLSIYTWKNKESVFPNAYLDYNSFDTGGYTGEWGADGRMAMLHEKEIVLNKHDTENFLDALSILRELNLSMMAQIGRFGMSFSNSQTSILQQLASQPIEQNVTIQAEFPNATDKDEIKEAFNDLINLATLYVHLDNKF